MDNKHYRSLVFKKNMLGRDSVFIKDQSSLGNLIIEGEVIRY